MLSSAQSFILSTERACWLSALSDPDYNLTIWHRDLPVDCEPLVNRNADDIVLRAPPHKMLGDLPKALCRAGYGDGDPRIALETDIAQLIMSFAASLNLDALELRLETVTSNACWKFHADYVRARLITTYHGSGTQYVDTSDAKRVARGFAPYGIHSLKTGQVGIFKGRLETSTPAIHRSPPIAGTGERRLLLVLSPVELLD